MFFHDIEWNIRYVFKGKEYQKNFLFCSDIEFPGLKLEFKSDKENILYFNLLPQKGQNLTILELYGTKAYVLNDNDKVFANGFQSWTDSREFSKDEKINPLPFWTVPISKKYHFTKYGDYEFYNYPKKPGEFHSYTYSYVRENNQDKIALIGSLSERKGFTIFAYSFKKQQIRIEKECRGLQLNKKYQAFELFYYQNTEESAFKEYFKAQGISKKKNPPVKGWTSWYNYYENINEEIILKNLNNFRSSKNKINYFQIDDGYQQAVGDWLKVDSKKFPGGLACIAEEIHKEGISAGLWLAPFSCEKNSDIFKQHQDWLVKDKKGKPVVCGSNWSWFYALDIYNNEVREYLKKVFDTVLKEWKFDLVKLDFLYSVAIIPRSDKTRGQIMYDALKFLREIIGDKKILGCGVPLGSAFGLVDYCRIGCDIGLDWDDNYFMRFLHRERISTLNSLRNTIGRYHLSGYAFENDPDVFLLREDNISLNFEEKKTLLLINMLFGQVLFTSDNLGTYTEEQESLYDYKLIGKEKIVEKIYNEDNFYKIYFKSDGKNYILFTNLSESIKAFELENSGYLHKNQFINNEFKEFVEGTAELKPHHSLLVEKVSLSERGSYE